MTVPMNDADLVQRVLDHLAAGTTDLGDTVWQEPVENYRSAERFALEMELLRSVPTAFCPSAALPGPGTYVARVHGNAPLLAVRGADGTVRVFHNACRHQGMMLAEGEARCAAGSSAVTTAGTTTSTAR
ncbi:MAG: Rieske 2Fe-2S domain-containing protein [Burkholderiaceae bacterium]